MPGIRSLAGCDADLMRILSSHWKVLDVGCGSGSRSAPFALAGAIGVDVHYPSLVKVRDERTRLSAICASLQVLPFRRDSVDAVIALDVIEHFPKPQATSLLREFERVARRAVILLTPNGFVPQAGTADNPFMEHRSGWSAQDFVSLGYVVRGINGWRPLRGDLAAPRFGPAGKILTLASQPLVRSRPEHAFHLLAIKRL